MVDQYHHGIRLVEVSNGARSLVTVATAIIGMVCTGPNADAATFPLNRPVIITDIDAAIIANQKKVGPFVFTYEAARTKPGFKDKLGRAQPARKKGDRYPMTAQVLRKPWAAAKESAGVENFRFHDLRHTRGTRILRATGNLAAAKEALKHRSIKTTLRYAHATDDDVRNALDASESRPIPDLTKPKARKA